jgi:uncharacterized protein YdaU (DUF1376 family)
MSREKERPPVSAEAIEIGLEDFGDADNNQGPRITQGAVDFWILPMHAKDTYLETVGLKPEQAGAYFRLMLVMWTQGGYVPDDDAELARIVGMSRKRWLAMRNRVLASFEVGNGVVTHSRITHEQRRCAMKSLIGKAKAGARWNKNKHLTNAGALLHTHIFKKGFQ